MVGTFEFAKDEETYAVRFIRDGNDLIPYP